MADRMRVTSLINGTEGLDRLDGTGSARSFRGVRNLGPPCESNRLAPRFYSLPQIQPMSITAACTQVRDFFGTPLVGRAVAEPPAPPAAESKTVRGAVKSFTTAPMGEVDGAVLDDGTVIHWPPPRGSIS